MCEVADMESVLDINIIVSLVNTIRVTEPEKNRPATRATLTGAVSPSLNFRCCTDPVIEVALCGDLQRSYSFNGLANSLLCRICACGLNLQLGHGEPVRTLPLLNVLKTETMCSPALRLLGLQEISVSMIRRAVVRLANADRGRLRVLETLTLQSGLEGQALLPPRVQNFVVRATRVMVNTSVTPQA